MTLDIESVLAGHVGSERGTHPGPFVVKCRCGDDGTTHRYPGDAWEAHRAHVAAVLREQITAARAEACRCSVRVRDVDMSGLYDDEDAAQVAPSRVPGEGS